MSIKRKLIYIFVFVTLFFNGNCLAQKPSVNEIECGESIVRLVSLCSDGLGETVSCKKQILSFINKENHKKRKTIIYKEKSTLLTAPIANWSCDAGKSNNYLTIEFCLASSCSGSNVLNIQIWEASGKKVLSNQSSDSLGIVYSAETHDISLIK